MHVSARQLADALHGQYASLRRMRQATSMTPAEVTHTLLYLCRLGYVETQRYPRVLYRIAPLPLPGEYTQPGLFTGVK